LVATPVQVVFDAADPDRLAHFWADALGYQLEPPPPGFATWQEFLQARNIPEELWNSASAVVDPSGRGPRIYFQRVPEPKTLKNRCHLDLNVGGGRTATVEERRERVESARDRLVGAGAEEIYVRDERGEYSITMADPEGNEFCLQ
jgi:hypothetical protein